ncbi:TPA: DUF551 domain-containing protein [Klebsiella pneumoniae]|nr:DUF551 domain-containing protein [Klebsiella pneumoniae]
MTKSTITRERIQRIIRAIDSEAYDEEEVREWLSSDEIMELSRMALTAMDSEPVAWRRFQETPTDGGYWILYDYKPNCSGVEPLYRHAQPAPVVPDDVLEALQKVARIRLDLNELDGDRRGIADCLGDAEEALIEVVNRRAAMLHAGTLTNEGTIQAVNSPVIPGWIPVSERMPEREVDVQVYCPDKKEQMVAYLERNELEGYFRFATWRTGEGIYCQPTHWMPLPAGPKEDINALIPLVSRNEQEVK